MRFSEILKELRLEKGVSQTELAKNCGVSSQCISSLEVGRRNPTGSTVEALANYFGVSADYLLGRTDDLGAVVISNQVASPLSDEERSFLDLFRRLSRGERVQLLAFAAGLIGKDRPETRTGD